MSRSFYGPITGLHNLNLACCLLTAAYGYRVFLVGSSMERRDYRDVDVRCMLGDAEFDAMFPVERPARLLALNLSVSAYLSHHSGLPVDFQFQRVSDANAEHGERPRSALGVERRSL